MQKVILRKIIEKGKKHQDIMIENKIRENCMQLMIDKQRVTILDLAKLVGIDRKKIERNSRLRHIIEESKATYYSKISHIDEFIEQLKKNRERITFVKLGDMIGLPPRSISRNKDLRVKIDKAREEQKIEIQKLVKKEVDRLRASIESISCSKIAKRLNISLYYILKSEELKLLIENGKKTQNQYLKEEIAKIAKILSHNKFHVSYQSVAEALGVEPKKIKRNNEFREIIDNYRLNQQKEKS